jgi:putative FmdB family regulatory protein
MPLYTYACDHHGEFSAWGRMSESDAPQPCPACTEPAPRALAHPSLGNRSVSDAMTCGTGVAACAPERPSLGGHHCGAGCMH